jgi:hypothetical protein
MLDSDSDTPVQPWRARSETSIDEDNVEQPVSENCLRTRILTKSQDHSSKSIDDLFDDEDWEKDLILTNPNIRSNWIP